MSVQPFLAAPAAPLRILPIPDHAVPALPADQEEPTRLDERQLAMRLELLTPAGAPRTRRSRGSSFPRAHPHDDPGPEGGRQLERPTGLPELQRWIAKLVPALLEVAAGTRPAPQLMRWVSPAVYEALLRRHTRALRRGRAVRRPIRIVRVILQEPVPAIVEASVVFVDGSHVRAAALRFAPTDRRWVAEAFEVG